MAQNKVEAVLNGFTSEVNKAYKLIMYSSHWNELRRGTTIPSFSKSHFESIIELSYLKAYLSWERFLEEAFLLLLLGQAPNPKTQLIRYAVPRNRKHAIEFVMQGKDFIDWASPEEIRVRANLFFKNGRPFDKPISSITHQLKNMKTIRNAITHSSSLSKDKFKSLVRGKISYYPQSLTVGGFLYTRVPNSSPPEIFFDYYFSSLLNVAKRIIH